MDDRLQEFVENMEKYSYLLDEFFNTYEIPFHRRFFICSIYIFKILKKIDVPQRDLLDFFYNIKKVSLYVVNNEESSEM
jgi:hypothetical protein